MHDSVQFLTSIVAWSALFDTFKDSRLLPDASKNSKFGTLDRSIEVISVPEMSIASRFSFVVFWFSISEAALMISLSVTSSVVIGLFEAST